QKAREGHGRRGRRAARSLRELRERRIFWKCDRLRSNDPLGYGAAERAPAFEHVADLRALHARVVVGRIVGGGVVTGRELGACGRISVVAPVWRTAAWYAA